MASDTQAASERLPTTAPSHITSVTESQPLTSSNEPLTQSKAAAEALGLSSTVPVPVVAAAIVDDPDAARRSRLLQVQASLSSCLTSLPELEAEVVSLEERLAVVLNGSREAAVAVQVPAGEGGNPVGVERAADNSSGLSTAVMAARRRVKDAMSTLKSARTQLSDIKPKTKKDVLKV